MKKEANSFSRFRADEMDMKRPERLEERKHQDIYGRKRYLREETSSRGDSFGYRGGEERKRGEGLREMNIHLVWRC